MPGVYTLPLRLQVLHTGAKSYKHVLKKHVNSDCYPEDREAMRATKRLNSNSNYCRDRSRNNLHSYEGRQKAKSPTFAWRNDVNFVGGGAKGDCLSKVFKVQFGTLVQ